MAAVLAESRREFGCHQHGAHGHVDASGGAAAPHGHGGATAAAGAAAGGAGGGGGGGLGLDDVWGADSDVMDSDLQRALAASLSAPPH